jgi:hypothetical protein
MHNYKYHQPSHVKNHSPNAQYIEQDSKQGPSSQFAERAGGGLQAALQQPAAKSHEGWVYVRRCTLKNFSLVLCCEVYLSRASLTQRDESQRIVVQYRVPVSGRSATQLHSQFSSPCRTLLRRATRGCSLKPPCRCSTLGDKESWCYCTASKPDGATGFYLSHERRSAR